MKLENYNHIKFNCINEAFCILINKSANLDATAEDLKKKERENKLFNKMIERVRIC